MYVHSRPFAANHPSAILNPNPMTPATSTPTTDQAEQTFVDSERGLLIAVLLMVVLGTIAVLVMAG